MRDTSLERFSLTGCGHFAHYGGLLCAIAQSSSKLFQLDMNAIIEQRDLVDIGTIETALTLLQRFRLSGF